MRLLDSHLSNKYETIGQILVRENAIVFSMEHAKLIIMADKVGTDPAAMGSSFHKGESNSLSRVAVQYCRHVLKSWFH